MEINKHLTASFSDLPRTKQPENVAILGLAPSILPPKPTEANNPNESQTNQ